MQCKSRISRCTVKTKLANRTKYTCENNIQRQKSFVGLLVPSYTLTQSSCLLDSKGGVKYLQTFVQQEPQKQRNLLHR